MRPPAKNAPKACEIVRTGGDIPPQLSPDHSEIASRLMRNP
jgi:hypothetical protein